MRQLLFCPATWTEGGGRRGGNGPVDRRVASFPKSVGAILISLVHLAQPFVAIAYCSRSMGKSER